MDLMLIIMIIIPIFAMVQCSKRNDIEHDKMCIEASEKHVEIDDCRPEKKP